ncbi:peptidylprolyl isomerase [Marinicella rhabdoformis]|uniref:peptidylprolyl isomerase n=1 Tax=Marinicella rhabdoformis TaxID=2580566 RepID=UPI0015D00DD1|nr:peptidylprolyl isomerase [Marinicella rhabdoformis]
MKQCLLLLILLTVSACQHTTSLNKKGRPTLNSSEILDQSLSSDWRQPDPENTLYITLKSGIVVLELATNHAPNHTKNTKALVRSGLFDNTRFYRVIDGFVAQGGPETVPTSFQSERFQSERFQSERFQSENGNLSIDPEFSITFDEPLPITQVKDNDGYAPKVGFYKGFAVGQSKDQKENWLLHCYGALGMGRANEIDSGGTELYVVIGHAQRYLDKNVTVFGRVIYGMEHLQALKRSTSLNGPVDVEDHNPIIKIQVASDMNPNDLIPLEILKTDSQSFKDYIQARKNRQEPWFIDSKNHIDVCAIQVPIRLKNQGTP